MRPTSSYAGRHIARSSYSRGRRLVSAAATAVIGVVGLSASAGMSTAHVAGTTSATVTTSAETAAKASPSTEVVDVSQRILTRKVVGAGASYTLNLDEIPVDATSATITVGVRYASRSTNVSLCAGAAVTSACTKHVVVTAPSQLVAWGRSSVDLRGADRRVTVYSASASVAVTLRLNSYTVPTASAGVAPSAAPTASPTPSQTATPSAKPTAVSSPAPRPTSAAPTTPPAAASASRWPDAANTGVPAGTKLTVHEGDLNITTPNTVIDSMEIRGLVRIEAPGVVIKNSLITGRYLSSSLSLIYIAGSTSSVTVQDSEIYAKYPSAYARGVIGQNFTLIRVNMHHVIDQMVITGDHVTVKDSWLHNNLHYQNDPMYNGGPSHDDNAQISIGKNLTFVHNSLDGGTNSAIQVTQDRGQVSNLTLSGNRISNGGCSVNIAQKTYGPVKNVVIKNNVFTHTSKFNCPIIADPATLPQISLSGNTWIDGKGAISITTR